MKTEKLGYRGFGTAIAESTGRGNRCRQLYNNARNTEARKTQEHKNKVRKPRRIVPNGNRKGVMVTYSSREHLGVSISPLNFVSQDITDDQNKLGSPGRYFDTAYFVDQRIPEPGYWIFQRRLLMEC